MKRHAKLVGFVFLSIWPWAPVAGALPASGRVVDFRAQPVAGAQVAVYQRYRVADEEYGRLAGPIVHTDRRGSFNLEADITSQYETFIVARKDGLALTWDGLNYGLSTKGRGRFLLVMERPAELTGVVVDSAGRPVAGAHVQAVPKTSYHRRLSQRPIVAPAEWFTTRTDAAGRFRFGAFSADVCADFRVQATGWASTYEFTTHYQDCCGFEVGRTDIRLVLPPEGKITGRVLNQDGGGPARNVSLVIRPKRERSEDIDKLYLPNHTVSDANGCFVFAGVSQRAHLIAIHTLEERPAEWVGLPALVEVKAGASTDNVTVTATKGGVIEATVRGEYSSKPLQDVFVEATDNERRSWQRGSTDAQGTARLRVMPGAYDIQVGGSGFLSWQTDQPVSVALGQTARLDVKLSAGPRVFGTVRDPDGAAVPLVFVKQHPFGDEAYTDETGSFTAGCNPQGGVEGTWLMALDERQGRAAAAQIIEKGKPTELVLRPALRVTGLVADANGTPIPAARIALDVSGASYLSELGPETLTDPNGRFRLAVVPPPEGAFSYALSVHATDYGPQTYRRVSVTGAPGATCDLGTITLPAANQSIAGVVVDGDGLPAPRIPIFLHGRNRVPQPDKSTATDEQGRFRITRICPGALRLQANFDSSPGGSSSIDAEGGQQDLRITLPGHLSTYASLAGKPLPDLREIVFPAALPDLGNHPVLLCFFDMEQRPSRRGLAELAKRAQSLTQQGITVLAIHIRTSDADSLARWTSAQSIPFPVGMLKEDAAKTRFAWGVQSLPWLVLADVRHIVRAEGFAVSELGSHIEAIMKTSADVGSVTPPGNGVTSGQRTAICLIKDTQGRVLVNDRIAVSPALAESPTDAEGKLVIRYDPPTDQRGLLTYLRHRNPDLIGSAWLPPAGGAVEVQLQPAVSVQGRALDPNGKPSAGVQVAALPVSSQFVLTNAAGDFDIAWAPQWAPGADLCLLARHPESNLTALVDIGSANKTIEVRLEPGLTLAGTVEEPNGAPVPGAAVRLALARGWTSATPVEPVRSDARGRWRVTALPQKQEYLLSARADNYGPGKSTTGAMNTRGDVAPVDPIILKRLNRSISGVVIDVNGLAVSGAQVVIDGQGQPRAEGTTGSDGRFTLARICDGVFNLFASAGQQRHGQILDAQPGRLSNEVVLFREFPRRATPAEGPFAADPQTGILKYRWSDRGWRLLEGKDWQRVRMTPEKPAGIITPNPVNSMPLFGRWCSPAVEGGCRWVMLDRSCRRGQYDRFIMDTNGDQRLDDEQVMRTHASSQPSEHAYITAFGPVPVLLDKSRGPATIHLSFGYYGQDRELCVGTIGWYEGYVSVGGTRMLCLLADKNADGTFTTPSSDPAESDLVGLGDEQQRVTCAPGGYVEVDGHFYRVQAVEDRDRVKLDLTRAEDVRPGAIRLPASISEIALAGKNGSFTLHPKEGLTWAPAGTYQLRHWLIRRTDTKGQHWTLKGHSFPGTGTVEVVPDEQINLGIGEPVLTSLERVDAATPYCTLTGPKLTGRSGEIVELNCREGPAPAQAHIRNADGTYDRTFTFEYG